MNTSPLVRSQRAVVAVLEELEQQGVKNVSFLLGDYIARWNEMAASKGKKPEAALRNAMKAGSVARANLSAGIVDYSERARSRGATGLELRIMGWLDIPTATNEMTQSLLPLLRGNAEVNEMLDKLSVQIAHTRWASQPEKTISPAMLECYRSYVESELSTFVLGIEEASNFVYVAYGPISSPAGRMLQEVLLRVRVDDHFAAWRAQWQAVLQWDCPTLYTLVFEEGVRSSE